MCEHHCQEVCRVQSCLRACGIVKIGYKDVLNQSRAQGSTGFRVLRGAHVDALQRLLPAGAPVTYSAANAVEGKVRVYANCISIALIDRAVVVFCKLLLDELWAQQFIFKALFTLSMNCLAWALCAHTESGKSANRNQVRSESGSQSPTPKTLRPLHR